MKIIVDPGTWPILDALEIYAICNIQHFIVDLNIPNMKFVRIPNLDHEGRYGFLIYKNSCYHEIQMPGLPLDCVRYMDKEHQNVWNFSRIYVDGGSWLWMFALKMLNFDLKYENSTCNRQPCGMGSSRTSC